MIVTWRRHTHPSRALARPGPADFGRAASLLDVPSAAAGAVLEQLEAAGATVESADLDAIERAVAAAAAHKLPGPFGAALDLARALETEGVLPLIEIGDPTGGDSVGSLDPMALAPAPERERPTAGGGS